MKTKLLFIALLTFFAVKMQAQAPCSALWTYASSPNGSVTFTATGTNSILTNYYWSFGNGTSGTGTTATTNYNAAGTFVVCLYVVDSINNCSDSSCQTITINSNPTPCTASYSYTNNSNGSVTCVSNGSASNTMTYTWTVNNALAGVGNTYTSSNTPGTYNICLLISDTISGCLDSVCNTITIGTTPPCQANFYIFPDSNGAPHTYIGVNTSNGGGLAMNYLWSWGDGTTSTGAYPSHTYASAGSYTICLYISTPAPNSCSDSLCLTSTINKTESMYTINFYAPNSVNDVKSELATIYPNPTKSSFMIKGNKSNTYAVDFYTVNGIKVKTSSVNANENMNISTLANGIYILKVIDQNGATQYSKLIKE